MPLTRGYCSMWRRRTSLEICRGSVWRRWDRARNLASQQASRRLCKSTSFTKWLRVPVQRRSTSNTHTHCTLWVCFWKDALMQCTNIWRSKSIPLQFSQPSHWEPAPFPLSPPLSYVFLSSVSNLLWRNRSLPRLKLSFPGSSSTCGSPFGRSCLIKRGGDDERSRTES